MNFSFAAYRHGSTNGQRPYAHVVVINATDKKAAERVALAHTRAYKVLGIKIGKCDPAERATSLANLYKHPCEVIEA